MPEEGRPRERFLRYGAEVLTTTLQKTLNNSLSSL